MIRALLAAVLLALLSIPAGAQPVSPATRSYTAFVTGSPLATLPFSAGDMVPVIQSGATKHVMATSALIAPVLSGTVMGNASGATGLPQALTTLPSGLNYPSPVFSGSIDGTYTLGGTPRVSGTGTYDLATIVNPMRYALWNLNLTTSVNTTNIWEGIGVFYTLDGPGHANGEINHFHANFIVNSGAFSAQSEGYESKLQNSGTVTERDEFLAIPQNNAAGTATRLYGTKCQLTQSNAAAGAVNTYACIDNEAMAGGGSQPTGNLFLRNADANAYSGILGHVNIGTLSDKGFPLYVQGSGNTSGTFSFVIKDSGGSTNEFFCQDDQTCTAGGSFNVKGTFQVNGKAAISPATPTISSGFGTGPSVTGNNGTVAFEVNVGTGGAATSGVIGLPTASTGWNCTATDITTNSATVFLTKQTGSSTTSATLGNFNTSAASAAWADSDKLRVTCLAF